MPNAKFIILLRNPIDRAFSHYNQNLHLQYEYLSFEEAIKREKQRIEGRYEKMQKNDTYYSWDYDLYGYLEHGKYVNNIKKWLEVFPREQFLILQTEEFLKNTQEIYSDILDFLGLPQWQPSDFRLYKKREYKNSLSISFRKELFEYFEPYNEELFKLLKIRYDWN